MRFDISRDFLDAVLLQHPKRNEEKSEVSANANMQFLPSSPDGTMHTAVVSMAIGLNGIEEPFAQGAWRFLFTSSEAFKPADEGPNPFLQHMLINGASRVLTVLNNLCLQANMPLIPIDSSSLAQQIQAQAAKRESDHSENTN